MKTQEKRAEVYFNGTLVGFLLKTDNKYFFEYNKDYLRNQANPPISLTLPKREDPYVSDKLFPFFYGLLSEGDNKELQCRLLSIDENDHFTRLIKTAELDTIGGITVREI
ncbi:MAG TPA: phosphatidylinositol kinase [Ignavibacteriales bacterium]|nr:phosphatidylinositol kinase [Ignavibacteriales bacterium]